MSSLNTVTLLGRLGKDPEVRNMQSGGRVVSFRLATSERYKDREGNAQERTEWHSVVIFHEKLGEIAERYLKKGDLALIQGKLETRKWEAQDGTDRYATEIVLRFDAKLVLMPASDRDRGSGGHSDSGGRDERAPRGGQPGGRGREAGWSERGGERPAERKAGFDDDIPF